MPGFSLRQVLSKLGTVFPQRCRPIRQRNTERLKVFVPNFSCLRRLGRYQRRNADAQRRQRPMDFGIQLLEGYGSKVFSLLQSEPSHKSLRVFDPPSVYEVPFISLVLMPQRDGGSLWPGHRCYNLAHTPHIRAPNTWRPFSFTHNLVQIQVRTGRYTGTELPHPT